MKRRMKLTVIVTAALVVLVMVAVNLFLIANSNVILQPL
jgi:hypothetical protein